MSAITAFARPRIDVIRSGQSRGDPAQPEPLTAACIRIALLVAFNQPFYPLYLWWIVGGDWRVGCYTFFSTPFFAAVPRVARRNDLIGRALLPFAGIANSVLSTKAFGEASGVELFLIPCGLLSLLAFRRSEWRIAAGLTAILAAAALMHGHYGSPLGRFDAEQYEHFMRLNATSVAILCIVIVWTFIVRRPSTTRP